MLGWIISIILLLIIWGMTSFIYLVTHIFGPKGTNKFLLFPMTVVAALFNRKRK